MAGFLSGFASAVVLAILAFLHVIVVETIRHGALGFLFGGVAGLVLGVIVLVAITVLGAIGGFIGGAVTK
jgi:hypothetical protein